MNTPALRDYRLLPLADLVPYARNARTHNREQVEQIVASIREFGWTNPVLVDAAGGIVAGHGRVLAAQRMGMAAVPCLVLDDLTDAQRRAYVLADNRLALNAGWDEAMLARELAALEREDVDLALLGFDAAEIDQLLGGGIRAVPGGAQLPADEEPEFTKITFSLPAADAVAVRRALAAARPPESPAENRNAAALAAICRQWMAAHGHG